MEEKTSRRHIQGSKIAKRLPSVKYSLAQYSKIEKFSKKNGPSGALKSHNAKKLKGGTLWGFSTSILSQNMKKLKKTKNFVFGKKSHSAEKNWKGTLWDFPTSNLSQNRKKFKGKKFRKKCLAVPKKIGRGTLWSPGYGMVRWKTGKTFLVQFARPNSAIWCNNIL